VSEQRVEVLSQQAAHPAAHDAHESRLPAPAAERDTPLDVRAPSLERRERERPFALPNRIALAVRVRNA
jgi:hypothetical protein